MSGVINTSEAGSFFDQQAVSTTPDDLISTQVDPTQPQVQGLVSVTDPLVADQHTKARLRNFDPEIYDLTQHSHLMRLLRALLGAAGVGGVRRQQTINRMTSALAGTHFLDLDGFWGALFGASRMTDEQLPQIDGVTLDPSVHVTDSQTWEAAASRDGKFRSRIMQLAHAFARGATYVGVRSAAEAVLGCEVDLMESWIYADMQVGNASTLNARTYLAVKSQYGTYGAMSGIRWGTLEGGSQIIGDLALGNRGEIVLTPKRHISEEERLQVMRVLRPLVPAGAVLTVLSKPIVSAKPVNPRYLVADSNDWAVVSSVTAYQGLTTLGDEVVYPPGNDYEAARPAFGEYVGERWSYNSRVVATTSYQMVNGEQSTFTEDYQTVTFNDGAQQSYHAKDALLDPKEAALSRLSADGVATSYPYPPGRFS